MKDRSQLKALSFKDIDANATIKFKDLEYAWRHPRHELPDGKPMILKDVLAMWESPAFIPKIINNNIQEAIEPELIATRLLQRAPLSGYGTYVDMPVIGAVDGDFEVGELETYPELRITWGPRTQIAVAPQKYGVAVKFSDEVLKYSQIDVISLATRQAARAMARNKEERIFNMWYEVARVSHDNDSPLNSHCGTTTGRDLTGALNGTLTMEDLFEMYAQVLAAGYTPDILIMHPLTWLIFIGDAQLRAWAQMNQAAFFGSQWTGNPSHKDYPDAWGGMALPGGSERSWPNANGHTPKDGDGNALPIGANGEYQNLKAAPVLPGYFGLPLRIIVSPWAPYNVATNKTSIIMADSRELGFYVEDMGPTVNEWKDPETDILKIKITERNLIRPKNRGLGLVIAKNITVDSNKIILPAQAQIGVAGSITLPNRNAAI